MSASTLSHFTHRRNWRVMMRVHYFKFLQKEISFFTIYVHASGRSETIEVNKDCGVGKME